MTKEELIAHLSELEADEAESRQILYKVRTIINSFKDLSKIFDADMLTTSQKHVLDFMTEVAKDIIKECQSEIINIRHDLSIFESLENLSKNPHE